MAVESPIQASDGWFFGEDKTLRFTVSGDVTGIAAWLVQFSLYRRKDRTQTPLLVKNSPAAVTPAAPVPPATTGTCTVTIAAVDTAALSTSADDQFAYVLRRTDTGNAQILAYGGAVIRSAVLT